MNGQKQKFSELKKQAREAMAGRCGTLVGATAINLFLTFSCSISSCISWLLMGFSASSPQERASTESLPGFFSPSI